MVLISLLLIAFSSPASSFQPLKSAHRDHGVSWRAYANLATTMQLSPEDKRRSAQDAAVQFRQSNLGPATIWADANLLKKNFVYLRDLRFIKDESHPNFLRRSTWLYPDDGCFARAALAVRNLMVGHSEAPKKIFVFGDLAVKTTNAPSGEVDWWYHVAPLVEVDGQKWVLDPAIEPGAPLKLEEWLARMSKNPDELEVAMCSSGAYTPDSNCADESDGREERAEVDQQDYLREEWSRLLELHRNPERELGDTPPWLKNLTGL